MNVKEEFVGHRIKFTREVDEDGGNKENNNPTETTKKLQIGQICDLTHVVESLRADKEGHCVWLLVQNLDCNIIFLHC